MKQTLVFAALLMLAGCNHTIQTSSGAEYISARANGSPGRIDKEIRQIAAVEPQLVFPAKIGVARVVNSQLTLPSVPELDLFGELSKSQQGLGTFISISPLVAQLANEGHTRSQIGTVQHIRRAAALQHLDYVLIYEVGARSKVSNSPFALADATLIGGAILPTRKVDVLGVGYAALIDVRNGYPYGSAQTSVNLTGLARSFGNSHRRGSELRNKATLSVAEKLIPEVSKMFTDLYKTTR